MYHCDRVIKASFRECPINERETFSHSSCLMPISIGQPVHEGDKLIATLKLVNKNFKQCVILIDDTVQRHTLKILSPNKTLDTLYDQALGDGDRWLNEYKSYINQCLNISYKIIRWDKWLYHKNYKNYQEAVLKLYDNNVLFKEAFDKNIFNFLSRFSSKHGLETSFDWNKSALICLDYLIEECACMCLWVEEKCEFELYPTGRNESMSATYEYLISPNYPGLLKPVALRFKKYGIKERNIH